MVQSVKELSRTSQDMSQKSAADPGQLGQLAANLSHGYSQLAADSRGAVMVANNTEIRSVAAASGRAGEQHYRLLGRLKRFKWGKDLRMYSDACVSTLF